MILSGCSTNCGPQSKRGVTVTYSRGEKFSTQEVTRIIRQSSPYDCLFEDQRGVLRQSGDFRPFKFLEFSLACLATVDRLESFCSLGRQQTRPGHPWAKRPRVEWQTLFLSESFCTRNWRTWSFFFQVSRRPLPNLSALSLQERLCRCSLAWSHPSTQASLECRPHNLK